MNTYHDVRDLLFLTADSLTDQQSNQLINFSTLW